MSANRDRLVGCPGYSLEPGDPGVPVHHLRPISQISLMAVDIGVRVPPQPLNAEVGHVLLTERIAQGMC